jgi:hypothetical protein
LLGPPCRIIAFFIALSYQKAKQDSKLNNRGEIKNTDLLETNPYLLFSLGSPSTFELEPNHQ